jgi:hypothetical protein|tara:strand:- start:54 stop:419 length:366 start_codon:yes stop_codon:yes gene_type:complete
MKEKETDIVKAILDYLAYKHIIAWRNQSGMLISSYKGKERAIRLGKKGVADIIGVFPDGSGRIMCLEVKTQIGKPTPEQSEFLESVREAGGIAEIVRSIEDVIKLIKPSQEYYKRKIKELE